MNDAMMTEAIARLRQQLDADRRTSRYWIDKWTDGDGDNHIEAWLDSLADQYGTPDPRPGCWVAYNADGSAFVPFADGDEGELAALRYALSLTMSVKRVTFGDEDWMRTR